MAHRSKDSVSKGSVRKDSYHAFTTFVTGIPPEFAYAGEREFVSRFVRHDLLPTIRSTEDLHDVGLLGIEIAVPQRRDRWTIDANATLRVQMRPGSYLELEREAVGRFEDHLRE